ncbi:MAG: cytochrome c [Crocinitomicaceae bacterium]|nr:cytochrome c [Crocinitomicaceae bacterium]
MVLKLIALFSFLALVLIGCTETPNPADDPNYKSRPGKKIYKERCISCHGSDGKLCDSGAKDLSRSKMDSVSIVDIITDGKNGMPRQGRYIFNDEEMSNTVQYVKSLRE